MTESINKTVIITPYKFIPPKNGGTNLSYHFAKNVSEVYPVTALSTFNNDSPEDDFILVKLFKDRKTKYFNPLLSIKFFRFFKKNKIKTCILHQPFLGFILLPILKVLNITLIVYVHNIEYQRFKTIGKWWWWILKPYEKLVYKNASKLFCISKDEIPELTKEFKIKNDKCILIPYGTYLQSSPNQALTFELRKSLSGKHNLNVKSFWILFFGPISYQPNAEAIHLLCEKIYPKLLEHNSKTEFNILICGGKKEMSEQKNNPIKHLGYVDDIDKYLNTADIVVNPIVSGGGVKTKVIEAIANGKTVVSFESGAAGIPLEKCGDKLRVIKDHDYDQFAKELLTIKKNESYLFPTPTVFYETFHWNKIAQKVKSELGNL